MELDVTWIILALGGVFAAMAMWGLTLLMRRFHLEISAEHRAALGQVLEKAVAYALHQAMGDDGKITVAVKNKALGVALDYAAKAAPDALAHFGINPATPDGRDRLRAMVTARLPLGPVAPAA